MPHGEDGTRALRRAWPSAQRRPGSPRTTLPGRPTESAGTGEQAPEAGRAAPSGSSGALGPGGTARACPAAPPLYLIGRRRRWEPGAGRRTGSASASLTWVEVRSPGRPRLTWQALPLSYPGRGGAPRWRRRGGRASLGLLEADSRRMPGGGLLLRGR